MPTPHGAHGRTLVLLRTTNQKAKLAEYPLDLSDPSSAVKASPTLTIKIPQLVCTRILLYIAEKEMQNHRAEITKDNIDPRARYRHPKGTEAPGIDRRTSAPSSTQGSRFESQQPHMDSGTAHTGDVSTWDCGSSLYDSFELVSLFNQLDRGLAPLHPSAIPADEINKSSDHKTKRLNISHAFRFCASPSNLCLENDFGTNYMNCECNKKKKKNPFRWLLRLSLSISHVLALWVDDERCPIHGHRIGQINDRDFCSLTEKKMTDYCSREYEQKSSPTAEDLVLPSG